MGFARGGRFDEAEAKERMDVGSGCPFWLLKVGAGTDEAAEVTAVAPGDTAENNNGGSRSAGSFVSTTDLERGFAVVRSAMDYAMRAGDRNRGSERAN